MACRATCLCLVLWLASRLTCNSPVTLPGNSLWNSLSNAPSNSPRNPPRDSSCASLCNSLCNLLHTLSWQEGEGAGLIPSKENRDHINWPGSFCAYFLCRFSYGKGMIVGGGIRVAERRTHLGVYALLMYGDAVILVRKGRGPYSGKWDLPGGRIEFGEAPQEALEREVRWTPLSRHRSRS